MTAKLLDVNSDLTNVRGEVHEEPKFERGKFLTKDGKWKLPQTVTNDDELVFEPVKMGTVIIAALEEKEENAEPKELLLRFVLSTKVAAAMKDGKKLEMDRDDERRLDDAALRLAKRNVMGAYRIREALSAAEPVKKGK